METSLFGLNQGSYFTQYGGQNTQEAAPFILSENGGYTSAVFHGNNAIFWNRNNTYKKLGYDYFFDQSYMSEPTANNSFQYGLNDKIMFHDSIQYLEHMQQPFYTKFITVSNHYPYQNLSGDEVGFPLAQTTDETINGYFSTANYLDSALKSFFDYLKEVGLYENSIFVLYGDHYGISNSRNPRLAELVGKDSETWAEYDNAMMQRVPYMIHIPGMKEGFISDTYGGEVDNLPTLLHLLGIDTSNYIQLGQDLLSEDNDQIVALRTSGYFITPQYTSYGGRIYDTETGVEITQPEDETQEVLQGIRDAVKLQLSISDSVQTGDLLRFYTGSGLGQLDSSTISYNDSLAKLIEIEKELGAKSKSLFSLNGNKTTIDLYDAPSYTELHEDDEKEKEQDDKQSSSSSSSSSSEESEDIEESSSSE
jgi:lipoteichoic acid synthase